MPPSKDKKLKGAIPKILSSPVDHSYTKATQKRKSRSSKVNKPVTRHELSESDTDIEEQAPCHMCKKAITMDNEGIKCNFCEHWLCFPCSKLKKVVYQALRESPDNVMWFCEYCCTAFPGVKKVMVQIGSLEDRYSNLEERVDKLEEKAQGNENTESIKEICKREIAEQQEIEKRKLNMVVFNVPESELQSTEARSADDLEKINLLLDGPLKLDRDDCQVQEPVRLGTYKIAKPNEPQKPRPIKFTVKNFESKNKILKANVELRKETGDLKNIYFTPDLTKTQRKEAFLLREKLRYQKNVLNKKNLKISRGRIVEINLEQDQQDDSTNDGNNTEHDVGIPGDEGKGATAMAVHPSSSH